MTFELDLVIIGECRNAAKIAAGGRLDNNVSLAASSGTNGTSTGSCAGAYPIAGDITYVSAAVSSIAGNTAILPGNRGSGFITLFNNTLFNTYVFCPVGGTINNFATTGLTTNNGSTFAGSFQVGSNKSATFMTPDGMNWLAQHAG